MSNSKMMSFGARQLLTETINVIDKQGWTQRVLVDDVGQCCIMGAIGVAGVRHRMMGFTAEVCDVLSRELESRDMRVFLI